MLCGSFVHEQLFLIYNSTSAFCILLSNGYGSSHFLIIPDDLQSKSNRHFASSQMQGFRLVSDLIMTNSKATFILLHFHFGPFLLPKTDLFSSLFTLLRFQTETDIYQLVFTLFLKNAPVFLLLTTRLSRLLILAFSNCSVFGVHTTELRFCLAPFSFSSVFIIVFI